MKKTLLLIMAIPLILLVTGCPNPGEPYPAPTGKMNVTIDGHNWTATNLQASEYTNNFGRTFYIRAANASDKWIVINFFGLGAAGNYPVTNNNNGPTGKGFVMCTYYSSYQEDPADTGQVTVTDVTDKSVTGDISFVTKSGINITNGTFNVMHQ
jgi:hypothetical protein